MSAGSKINFQANILKFTYEIEHFKIDSEVAYWSDEFYFAAGQDQSKWRILVETKSGGDKQFGVFFNLLTDHDVKVKCSFKIIDPKNQVIDSFMFTYYFKKNDGRGWAFNNNILTKALSPDNVFRVICEMELVNDPDFPVCELSIYENLQEIYSEDFFDLKIKVENQTLMAHRLIVSAASPVLHEKIKRLKHISTPLKLDGFSFETIQEVINFIYKKEFKLNKENVEETLRAANEFEFTNLKMTCEKFAFENLSVENSLKTLSYIDPNKNKKLFEKTYEFIEKNIDPITRKKQDWQTFIEEYPNKFNVLFQKIFINLSKELSEKLKLEGKNTPKNVPRKSTDTSTAIKDLSNLYESMLHADVVFDVNGKYLKAHKAILCCRSTVFESMFKHDTSESQTNTIKIQDADYDTMKKFLEFIYCEKVSNIDGSATELFTVADKYDLPELKDLCSDWMKENLTVDNVLDIFTLANLHSSLQAIKTQSFYFILQNFEKKILKWKKFAKEHPQILDEFLVQALELRNQNA